MLNSINKKALSLTLALFLLTILTARAEADSFDVKLTNKTGKTVYVAFAWYGLDYDTDEAVGWYTIDAQKSRTISFKRPRSGPIGYIGYYATSGKLVWRGSGDPENDGSVVQAYIDPKNKFKTVGGSLKKKKIKGGKLVTFRQSKAKSQKNGVSQYSITFTASK